ncbi:amino acid ABC transporter substrate-binding protein [Brochothrix thermosphacta]|uniref:amino acid ABC transporter substrate-binding protein n=1 Tax=Brochothrix thermosphacta TaxID=2756 RepID=UPI000E732AA1|nr:amino acid ABC transporter substrate-binding protein [Brochothrix thermosphacta]ANZ96367.1 L-cystine-binding protein TcyJ [Brochothrix thermosphacta]HCZ39199.1 amino acid ABC transporter substrate-binding protein [Brochothrix thermosphacta]HCZ45590.1 amino acid ABC transporter substrate-binding protein [Brochothrix thermosphacta]
MKKILLCFTALTLIFLVACAPKAATSDKKKNVETIIVGTGTQYPGICFIDENGKLTGYDIEVIRAIDKKLPQYNFEFKTMDFANLLTSLGANKIDMIAHNMAKNKEREEKFLFNNEPYNYSPLYITVAKDNNDVKSIKDLDGKKVVVSATSNAADYVTEYNKKNGNKIEIAYAGQGSNDTANQLKNGRADATLSTPFAVKHQNDTSSIKEKVVGDILLDTKVYFVFPKQKTDLSKAVDTAIKELSTDGTLKKLSKRWLGDDYSKSSFK